MRRFDLHPLRKLRNPARHLRQLAEWPERIVAQLPMADEIAGERFLNFKVPVYAKLVDPPHATVETQRACLEAVFAAVEAIERSALRPKDCRVACLVTTPFLFESEVTLFFDEDYFQTFLPAASANAKRATYDGGWVEGGPSKDAAGIEAIMPPPDGLIFQGGVWLRQFEEGRGLLPERTTWVWAYPRR